MAFKEIEKSQGNHAREGTFLLTVWARQGRLSVLARRFLGDTYTLLVDDEAGKVAFRPGGDRRVSSTGTFSALAIAKMVGVGVFVGHEEDGVLVFEKEQK